MPNQHGMLQPVPTRANDECRILHILAATDVPVPKLVLPGGVAHVSGTSRVSIKVPQGRVFTNCALPELPPGERRAVYFAMAETLAKLHRVDWAAAGLAACGRSGRFYAREVVRYTQQWKMSKDSGNKCRDMDCLAHWLSSHIPDDDEAAFIHGDFGLDKLVFDAAETRVVAVLGWQRATLGHPLADVAHSCVPWHLAPEQYDGLYGLDLAAQGIPSQAEYLTHYRQCGGYAESINTFHLAFALFRRAVEECSNGNAPRAFALARRGVELIDGMQK